MRTLFAVERCALGARIRADFVDEFKLKEFLPYLKKTQEKYNMATWRTAVVSAVLGREAAARPRSAQVENALFAAIVGFVDTKCLHNVLQVSKNTRSWHVLVVMW